MSLVELGLGVLFTHRYKTNSVYIRLKTRIKCELTVVFLHSSYILYKHSNECPVALGLGISIHLQVTVTVAVKAEDFLQALPRMMSSCPSFSPCYCRFRGNCTINFQPGRAGSVKPRRCRGSGRQRGSVIRAWARAALTQNLQKAPQLPTCSTAPNQFFFNFFSRLHLQGW